MFSFAATVLSSSPVATVLSSSPGLPSKFSESVSTVVSMITGFFTSISSAPILMVGIGMGLASFAAGVAFKLFGKRSKRRK